MNKSDLESHCFLAASPATGAAPTTGSLIPRPTRKGLGDTWRGFPCVGRLEQQFYQVATFFHVLKNLMRFVHKTGDLVCMGMLPSVTRPFSVIFARGPL